MTEGWRIAAIVLTLVGYAFALVLVPRIIQERRHPAATTAWALAIILLPALGVPFYYVFGERRIRRHIRAKIETVGSLETSVEHRVSPASLPGRLASTCSQLLFRAGAFPPVTGNRVTLLHVGEESYFSLLRMIQESRDHLHAQFFILEADPVGKRFIHALAARARAGIRVRLLLDAVGSFRALRGIVRPLVRAGGEVAEFLPALPLHRKWSAHLRNHRKLLIADGTVAFSGGMNIGVKYMGPRAIPGRWRDTAVLFKGPVVRDLQALFLDDWAFTTEETVPAGNLFPSLPPLPSVAGGGEPLQVVAAGPDRAHRPIYQGIFAAFTNSRERIWIATPYFVPDDSIRTALENAAMRGVDVRLLVPEKLDTKLVWLAGRSYFEDLMEAGARIYVYQPRVLHAKFLVIDRDVAVVGSSNVDIRSFFLNFELGFFLYDRNTVEGLARRFEEDLRDARELSAESFRRRGRTIRFLEDTCRVFSPLL